MTCALGGVVVSKLNRYVERGRSGKSVPPLAQLHEHVRAEDGYGLSYAALMKHVRECLGYSSRAR